jgi:3-mercaptopyruvate sulfurtransferase SseA
LAFKEILFVKRSSGKVFPIVVVAAGLVVLLVAGFWALNTSKPSSTATPTTNQADIPFPEIPRIRLPDAKAAYDIKNAVFVDVRGEPFYSQGHIPGAISIPLADIPTRLGELNKTDWIIPYCT